MKKVFIIHGFEGSPNGGWRPWLMAELNKRDIYACALAMPNSNQPICDDWIEEISRHINTDNNAEVYLVGHSLGAPAILNYLENTQRQTIAGAVLVSGFSKSLDNVKIDNFVDHEFDFNRINSKCDKFILIHGDNDPHIPLEDAKSLARQLKADIIVIKNGAHLNGSAGFTELPECLVSLNKFFKTV